MDKYFFYLLSFIFRMWTIIAFTRFFLEKGGLSVNHPLSRFCINCTDFIVKKVNKHIKPVDGWNISIIFVVIVGYFIFDSFLFILRYFLHLYPLIKANIIIYIVGSTFIDTSYSFCYTLMTVIFLYSVLSLSEVINPLVQVLFNIIHPLSKLFGDIRLGKLNFSLLIVFILLFFWINFVVEYLFVKLLDIIL